MRKVYSDNAATTPVAPEVVEAMIPALREQFGNPSSTHAFGRSSRAVIERARRSIAKLLNTSTQSIVFTSGGTEADNMAIMCSLRDLGVSRIITSPIEHHAVLHTAEAMATEGACKLELVKVNDRGEVDLNHLEELLKSSDEKTLVSLMHANNEIGTLIDLTEVGNLVHSHGAIFHSDTVQSMAHYEFDMQTLPVDFITCAAHKFHGPKGVGFLYINPKLNIKPIIHGGAQERNLRGGTENLIGIVGLAKAMETAYEHLAEHRAHIESLKAAMIMGLRETVPNIQFNGCSSEMSKSLYTVLSVCFPKTEFSDFLLINLDILGIAASGGSACSSGSNVGSHVLAAVKGSTDDRPTVRFSFGRFTTHEEVDYALAKVRELYLDSLQKA